MSIYDTSHTKFLTNSTQIAVWLKKHSPYLSQEEYTIREDFSVDVFTNLFLNEEGLKTIPVKFNRITGVFNAGQNKLVNLDFAPKICDQDFNVSDNLITSLKGGPEIVQGNYMTGNNRLTNLMYSPKNLAGSYYCNDNLLNSLKGAPRKVAAFYCYNNLLRTLEGGPQYLITQMDCRNNDLENLDFLPIESECEIKGRPMNYYFNCEGSHLLGEGQKLKTLEHLRQYNEIVKEKSNLASKLNKGIELKAAIQKI